MDAKKQTTLAVYLAKLYARAFARQRWRDEDELGQRERRWYNKGVLSVRFEAGEGKDKLTRVVQYTFSQVALCKVRPEVFAQVALCPEFAKFWEAVVLSGLTEKTP